MTSINDIRFYEVARKRPKGEKKTKWARNTNRFDKKAKLIKMKANLINQKLVNY